MARFPSRPREKRAGRGTHATTRLGILSSRGAHRLQARRRRAPSRAGGGSPALGSRFRRAPRRHREAGADRARGEHHRPLPGRRQPLRRRRRPRLRTPAPPPARRERPPAGGAHAGPARPGPGARGPRAGHHPQRRRGPAQRGRRRRDRRARRVPQALHGPGAPGSVGHGSGPVARPSPGCREGAGRGRARRAAPGRLGDRRHARRVHRDRHVGVDPSRHRRRPRHGQGPLERGRPQGAARRGRPARRPRGVRHAPGRRGVDPHRQSPGRAQGPARVAPGLVPARARRASPRRLARVFGRALARRTPAVRASPRPRRPRAPGVVRRGHGGRAAHGRRHAARAPAARRAPRGGARRQDHAGGRARRRHRAARPARAVRAAPRRRLPREGRHAAGARRGRRQHGGARRAGDQSLDARPAGGASGAGGQPRPRRPGLRRAQRDRALRGPGHGVDLLSLHGRRARLELRLGGAAAERPPRRRSAHRGGRPRPAPLLQRDGFDHQRRHGLRRLPPRRPRRRARVARDHGRQRQRARHLRERRGGGGLRRPQRRGLCAADSHARGEGRRGRDVRLARGEPGPHPPPHQRLLAAPLEQRLHPPRPARRLRPRHGPARLPAQGSGAAACPGAGALPAGAAGARGVPERGDGVLRLPRAGHGVHGSRAVPAVREPAAAPGLRRRSGEEVQTPSLRFVGGTPPYLHDGRFPTLAALVRGNDDHMGKTNHLTADDKSALVAFLETL